MERERRLNRDIAAGAELPPVTTEAAYVPQAGEIVAQNLAGELGTAPKYKAIGEIDMRLFSVIEERDIPFLIYARIRGQKTRVWRMLYNEFLHLKVSVGGRGRRDVIRMQGVARGGLPSASSIASEVGGEMSWIERHITKRAEWKKRQQMAEEWGVGEI